MRISAPVAAAGPGEPGKAAGYAERCQAGESCVTSTDSARTRAARTARRGNSICWKTRSAAMTGLHALRHTAAYRMAEDPALSLTGAVRPWPYPTAEPAAIASAKRIGPERRLSGHVKCCHRRQACRCAKDDYPLRRRKVLSPQLTPTPPSASMRLAHVNPADGTPVPARLAGRAAHRLPGWQGARGADGAGQELRALHQLGWRQ